MNPTTKLQQTIQTQEVLASKLDQTSPEYYKELYELLSVAYFAAKDLIALQGSTIPTTKDNPLEVPLRDAKGTIAVLETSLEVVNKDNNALVITVEQLNNKLEQIIQIVS